ncbi:unnamed protein product [Rhizophagus irregularis]|nr:unnamed protein product [Rhizophagus irregularis]
MESCFPRLHEKKEAWNKVLDIVILSMFSRDTKIIRGGGVLEMVQYGFAQLCSFKRLADLNTLQKDAITVQIAEPIPILAFREYIRRHPEVFETKVGCLHYNASCAGFLFKPCLTIPLAELFNAKSFQMAKLVKDPDPPGDTGGTTDPYHFYSHGNKRTELKEKLRGEVLDCLESKYCKAHELSWIRFLVVFPAETKQRTVASYYNYSKANELFIVIDPSNAELFFSSFGHNVLKELKRIADNDKLELERATKKIKTSD